MNPSRLVIKNHHPAKRPLLAAGLLILLSAAAWGVYELGLYQGGIKRVEVARERDALQQRIDELTLASQQQREQMTMARRGNEIDQAAYKEVRDNLKSLQEEILELREEVEFYRGIVSPVERQVGLNIQNFKLFPAGEDRLYHFELVLTQVLKNDRTATGTVNFVVRGVQAGEPKELRFKDISPNNSIKNNFRFRYFQKTEGDIRLPVDFVPRTVTIEIMPVKRKVVSKTFDWLVTDG